VKKLLLMFVVSALALSVNGQALASNTGTTDTSVPAIYDLENEPSQCIGLLPRPGCGKKPEDAGERGGALQYSVVGLMITGLGVIGLGMVRGIRKQKPQS
jgi:hypothetical protein